MDGCPKLMDLGETEEILCFQYQRMMRYGGTWHLEKKMALPGCVFVAGTNVLLERNWKRELKQSCEVSLIPCEVPYLKELCDSGSIIEISRGIIRNGAVVVSSGPLKGRESLIRRIDRHKRTAQIEIPFSGSRRQITVGLEIYDKEI